MAFRFEHSCIYVHDLDRSVAFYEKALGLHVVSRFSPPDNEKVRLVFLGDDVTGQMLELGYLGELKPEPYELGDNSTHLAFVAENMEEAHALHAQLGCICQDDPAAEVYFIEDPDGYRSEIVPPVRTQRPF